MKNFVSLKNLVHRRWGKPGAIIVALAIAGCAHTSHSMDAKDEGMHGGMDHHKAMDHEGMDHGEMNHGEMPHDAMDMDEAKDAMGAGHGHSGMHHGTLEVEAGQPAPTVMIHVEPDAMRGWNLQVMAENFAFAPERVNQDSQSTEGHAHLFINGEKVTRLYGPWYYLPSLPAGEHELRVELNANGHETLTVAGEPIEATVKVVVPTP